MKKKSPEKRQKKKKKSTVRRSRDLFSSAKEFCVRFGARRERSFIRRNNKQLREIAKKSLRWDAESERAGGRTNERCGRRTPRRAAELTDIRGAAAFAASASVARRVGVFQREGESRAGQCPPRTSDARGECGAARPPAPRRSRRSRASHPSASRETRRGSGPPRAAPRKPAAARSAAASFSGSFLPSNEPRASAQRRQLNRFG